MTRYRLGGLAQGCSPPLMSTQIPGLIRWEGRIIVAIPQTSPRLGSNVACDPLDQMCRVITREQAWSRDRRSSFSLEQEVLWEVANMPVISAE